MSADFKLVVLDCPQCGAPLAAEDEDLVYYCTACHSGFRVPEEGEEGEPGEQNRPSEPGKLSAPAKHEPGKLVPVEVSFLATPAQPADLHLPFWLLPARVEMLERKGSGDLFRGLLRFFMGRDEESDPGEGTFAIPAFRAPLQRVVALAQRYTFERPATGELSRERLLGGTCTVSDARKLAEYVLIASEARKPDMLEELQYRISFGPARLLGVPFKRQKDRRWDLFFDLPG